MNRTLGLQILAALACVTLSVPPVWARVAPGSGLAGSPHDFTNPSRRVYQLDPNASTCAFCHVGQQGSAAVDRSQWNRRLSTSTSTWNASNRTSSPPVLDAFDSPPPWNPELTANSAFYTMYQNGPGAPQRGAKASQAIIDSRSPGTISLLCLSCHDGSAAINLYGNGSRLTRFHVIGQDRYLGNHHPVGFDYDAVRAVDKEIRSADTTYLTATTTVRDHLYGPENSRMECGTCHSVHNAGNSGETLLWRSDVRSNLCLTCHDKGRYTAPSFSSATQDAGD
jgi:predicted CXXCH cytochrome family protein